MQSPPETAAGESLRDLHGVIFISLFATFTPSRYNSAGRRRRLRRAAHAVRTELHQAGSCLPAQLSCRRRSVCKSNHRRHIPGSRAALTVKDPEQFVESLEISIVYREVAEHRERLCGIMSSFDTAKPPALLRSYSRPAAAVAICPLTVRHQPRSRAKIHDFARYPDCQVDVSALRIRKIPTRQQSILCGNPAHSAIAKLSGSRRICFPSAVVSLSWRAICNKVWRTGWTWWTAVAVCFALLAFLPLSVDERGGHGGQRSQSLTRPSPLTNYEL